MARLSYDTKVRSSSDDTFCTSGFVDDVTFSPDWKKNRCGLRVYDVDNFSVTRQVAPLNCKFGSEVCYF